MEYLVWGWLGALILFIIIEIATTSLTTIWFAGGSLAAFLANVLNAPLWLQIVLFIVVSLVLLIFTRPIMLKAMKSGEFKTNVDSLIGKQAKVTENISNIDDTGTAVVNGQEWTARNVVPGEVIEAGEIVEIVEISGVKLIVKK
ncbi:MAG: NfeD family protein [Lachnospiraceae bacterium]|nr:NfeD family protein [Lachnospiraceae bacterium]